ncbi:MAG: molybdopterin-dependent oxidoreductase [Caldilineaceae bacterium]|nr:molybdopterin-dependent oxidoreductase [Caldilineaceae bacterium]
MRPRVVDWTLFILVTLATLSGFASFLVGLPKGWWVFMLHGAGGLAVVLPLVWKMRRVWPRLARPYRWERATVASLLTLLAVLLVLATGVVWSTWQWPARFPNGLWWHVALGLALAILLLFHVILRFKPLRRSDLRDRRAFLHLAGIGLSGLLLWGGNQAFNRAASTPGDRRRFTGSRNAGDDFPVTMWMFDNPAPIDLSTWRLRITGAVAKEYAVDYTTLAARTRDRQEATLDCTSGWYTTQRWQGVRVGHLLAHAQPNTGAVAVSFKSITGYRWSLPLSEAYAALLATHVGNTPLTHGYGAPIRLVAPGRRGFQWVKWVTEIEVLTQPDRGQWQTIFLSGLGK